MSSRAWGRGEMRSAEFIGLNRYGNVASQLLVIPAGSKVGDLAIVIINNSSNGAPTLPGGWTITSLVNPWALFGYHDFLGQKVLDAGDIAAGTVLANSLGGDGIITILVYRGVDHALVTATKRTSVDNNLSTTTIPGFTKSATCRALLFYCCTRQPNLTLVSPSGAGFAKRLDNYWINGGTNFKTSIDDMLNVGYYTNGTNVVYTGGATETIGVSIELT